MEHLQSNYWGRFKALFRHTVIDIARTQPAVSHLLLRHGKSEVRLQADAFVNCTNAWSMVLERLLYGVNLDRMVDVVPVQAVPHHLWFFNGWSEATPTPSTCMTVLPSGVYARPEAKGAQLMMGYSYPVQPLGNFAWHQQDEPHRAAESKGVEAGLKLIAAMPWLADAGFNPEPVVGLYGQTPDGLPFIGLSRYYHNWFRAVGFSGRGIMMAPFAATAVTRLIQQPSSTTCTTVFGDPVGPTVISKRVVISSTLKPWLSD